MEHSAVRACVLELPDDCRGELGLVAEVQVLRRSDAVRMEPSVWDALDAARRVVGAGAVHLLPVRLAGAGAGRSVVRARDVRALDGLFRRLASSERARRGAAAVLCTPDVGQSGGRSFSAQESTGWLLEPEARDAAR